MNTSKNIKFLQLAGAVATIFSKDPSTQVGAVAVGRSANQVAFGYNGLPPGLADTPARLADREARLRLTLHAEENALLNAPFPVECLYVTHHPCSQCAKRILAARTVRHVYYQPQPAFDARWAEEAGLAQLILAEGGVTVHSLVVEP